MPTTSNPFNEPLRSTQYGAMQHWYSALANRDYANVKIMGVGDSIMQGFYSTDFVNRSYMSRLLARLRSHYQPGGTSTGGIGWRYNSDQVGALTPWTTGGSTALSQLCGMPLGCFGIAADGGTSFAQLVATGTSADIYYLQFPAKGTISVSVDGGAAQTQASAGSSLDARKFRVTLGASASHTIKVTATGADVIIDGAMVFNGDENFGFSLMNGGRNSWGMQDWFTFNGGVLTQPSYKAFANGYQPDLVIMNVGINDWLFEARTPAQFGTDLQTFVTGINASVTVPPTILFVAQYEGGSQAMKNTAAPRVWADFVAQYYKVAAANSNVALLDLSRRIKPPLVSNVDGIGYSDLLHLTDQGHAYVADAVFDFLRHS